MVGQGPMAGCHKLGNPIRGSEPRVSYFFELFSNIGAIAELFSKLLPEQTAHHHNFRSRLLATLAPSTTSAGAATVCMSPSCILVQIPQQWRNS